MVFDEKTGLAIGDPKEVIFPDVKPIRREEKEEFLKNSIFSVSGWRRVFAADGGEQSSNPEINILEALLVYSLNLPARFIKAKNLLLL